MWDYGSPHLTHLQLSFNKLCALESVFSEDREFDRFIQAFPKPCQTLERLSLGASENHFMRLWTYSENKFDDANYFPNLKEFAIHGFDLGRTSSRFWQELTNMPHLQRLTVFRCDNIDNLLSNLVHNDLASDFMLQHLVHEIDTNDVVLRTLLGSCEALKSLHVKADPFSYPPLCIEHIKRHGSSLRTLALHEADADELNPFSVQDLESLHKSCYNIRFLGFQLALDYLDATR